MDGVRLWLGEPCSHLRSSSRSGEVLYVPEGYYFAHRGVEVNGDRHARASFVMREATLFDVGTEYYALVEGKERLALQDYIGAIKFFKMGLERIEVPSTDVSLTSGRAGRVCSG